MFINVINKRKLRWLHTMVFPRSVGILHDDYILSPPRRSLSFHSSVSLACIGHFLKDRCSQIASPSIDGTGFGTCVAVPSDGPSFGRTRGYREVGYPLRWSVVIIRQSGTQLVPLRWKQETPVLFLVIGCI